MSWISRLSKPNGHETKAVFATESLSTMPSPTGCG